MKLHLRKIWRAGAPLQFALTILLFSALPSLYPAGQVDLSHVPQLNETAQERDGRMQWFRDAKFGMFIHWGPSSVGAVEIGWGRRAARPWDIGKTNDARQRTEDPVYDNYYRQFNPVNFDAKAWARFAREFGMKYMVIISKHHDGFSMFDSKVADYDIMATPYGRDIIKQIAAACHQEGLKLGFYYSTRDWYHPDYLQGDNSKYDRWYRAQIEELLTNYGQVDVMWFDSVGGNDWGKWRFDELFAMMYRLQPRLIINNRVKFVGPKTPDDRSASPEVGRMTKGDFYTPEGVIGKFDIEKDWESCMRNGRGWSYRGEDSFREPEDVVRMLVSSVTGGGNLLLNFGPRADGTFADGDLRVGRAMGQWLGRYGEAIYGTRGGPYRNGDWGGSTHKGSKIFLHLFQWQKGGVWEFDALPYRIQSARTLTGRAVEFAQTRDGLTVKVPLAGRDNPVTIVELTLDQAVEVGRVVGNARGEDRSEHGRIISENATLELSSTSHRDPGNHERLFKGEKAKYGTAFVTDYETNPWAKIDLGAKRKVNAVVIENKPTDRCADGLILSVSLDGRNWDQVWQAPEWDLSWTIPVTHFYAGAEIPGREVRYIKVETKGTQPRALILQRVTVYGE